MSGFGVSWRRQSRRWSALWLMTDARHRNSILNNEQHLFTPEDRDEKTEEKWRKVLESASNWLYLYE
jgi:hypothetical protein